MDIEKSQEKATELWSLLSEDEVKCDICSSHLNYGEGYLCNKNFQKQNIEAHSYSSYWPDLVCESCLSKHSFIPWDGTVELLQVAYLKQYQNKTNDQLFKEGRHLFLENIKHPEKLSIIMLVLIENGATQQNIYDEIFLEEDSGLIRQLANYLMHDNFYKLEKNKKEKAHLG